MSDLNRKTQSLATSESADLSMLSATKDLHELSDKIPANTADLASASISPAEVMRSSSRTDIRKAVQDKVPAHSASVELTNSRSRAQNSSSANSQKPGVFKNPFYRYDGGLINKILSLIANILKVLERFFLRLLGARDKIEPQQRQQSTPTKPEDGALASKEEQLERDKRKERREAAEQLVKRQ